MGTQEGGAGCERPQILGFLDLHCPAAALPVLFFKVACCVHLHFLFSDYLSFCLSGSLVSFVLCHPVCFCGISVVFGTITFVVLHFHCLEAENLWLHHHIIKSACLWGSHSVVGERLLGQLLLPPLHQVVPNRPSMSSRVIHRLVLKRKTLNWAVADTSLLGSGDSKSMNGCHFPQQKSAFISCMSLDGTLPDRLLETMTEEAKQTDEHTTV